MMRHYACKRRLHFSRLRCILNLTNTETLKPLLERMKIVQKLPHYLVADEGYGSEINYCGINMIFDAENL